jgi:hypothetical protein
VPLENNVAIAQFVAAAIGISVDTMAILRAVTPFTLGSVTTVMGNDNAVVRLAVAEFPFGAFIRLAIGKPLYSARALRKAVAPVSRYTSHYA